MAMIRASVLGGAIAGALEDDRRVRVVLRADVVRDRARLARGLEALGRALWAARTRAFLEAAGADREPVPMGWRATEYVRRRAAIVACGRSRDGAVTVRVAGMRDWRVEIAGDVTERKVQEAAEELLRDQGARILALKRTIWQPRGTPAASDAGVSWDTPDRRRP
ncbi:hypothetical protein [Dactylosporangium sp. CA-233914]|uniref:hypothetical protein n=1 Tax=Dactylosporangium sp. CA-233914 TaxID=3239934 RepID=UPI003D917799